MVPHSTRTIPYKISAAGGDLRFDPIPSVMLDVTGPLTFEMTVAQVIAGERCMRRLLQPNTTDRPIGSSALACGIPFPREVNLVFGWNPIIYDKFQANLSIAIQLYDSDGHIVDTLAKSFFGVRWRKQACGGAVIVEDEHAFEMKLGLFVREFYQDHFNVKINLKELPPQVRSISFVAYNRHSYDKVHEFKRKFVRMIDPLTRIELGLFHYRLESSSDKEACLIGGMYIGEYGWTFAPVVQLFSWQSGFDHIHQEAQALWMGEMAARDIRNAG
jgi:hypothetical protein